MSCPPKTDWLPAAFAALLLALLALSPPVSGPGGGDQYTFPAPVEQAVAASPLAGPPGSGPRVRELRRQAQMEALRRGEADYAFETLVAGTPPD